MLDRTERWAHFSVFMFDCYARCGSIVDGIET